MDEELHPDSAIIERLGGPVALAAELGITSQAVSQWKRKDNGIPPARRMYLQLKHPAAFQEPASQQAAA